MSKPSDRFVIHAVFRNEEHAQQVALAYCPPLATQEQTNHHGAGLGRFEVAGTVDGVDLALITSTAARFRESLSFMNINRVVWEETL